MADRSPTTRFLVRWLLYPLQALLIGSLYYAIRVLPLRWGTSIGSFLFRTIGQRMRVARVAAQNVRRVFPELKDREDKALLENIWAALGAAGTNLPWRRQSLYRPIVSSGAASPKR